MKVGKILLSLAVVGSLTVGFAEVSIDAQIEAIQNAPQEQRVEMMNQLKEQIANMNQAERMDAISQLQEKMGAKHAQAGSMGDATKMEAHTLQDQEDRMGAGQGMGEHTQERAMEHANEMQMQANEHMNQMQNMNQNRAGNQFSHEGGMTPPTGGAVGGSNPAEHGGNYGSRFMGGNH